MYPRPTLNLQIHARRDQRPSSHQTKLRRFRRKYSSFATAKMCCSSTLSSAPWLKRGKKFETIIQTQGELARIDKPLVDNGLSQPRGSSCFGGHSWPLAPLGSQRGCWAMSHASKTQVVINFNKEPPPKWLVDINPHVNGVHHCVPF